MPFYLAGVPVKRHGRGCVEIVARPHIAEPWRGISRSPKHCVRVGIVVAGHPRRGAACLPGIRLLPGLASGLSGRGHGIGLPRQLSSVGIERHDEAAHAELTAGDTNQHFALHDERCHRRIVTGLPIFDLGFPGNLSGFRVERHEGRIQSWKKDLVAIQSHAAACIVQSAEARWQLALVAPQQITGCGVQRHDLAVRRGDEHHAVVHDRRGFMAGINTRRDSPNWHEVLHVPSIDLIERTVAPSLVAAASHEPVFRLWVGQSSVGHRRIICAISGPD